MQYLNFVGSCEGDVGSTAVLETVTTCSVIDMYNVFNLLRMKATGSSEMLVHVH
jgi:hypothetical protein